MSPIRLDMPSTTGRPSPTTGDARKDSMMSEGNRGLVVEGALLLLEAWVVQADTKAHAAEGIAIVVQAEADANIAVADPAARWQMPAQEHQEGENSQLATVDRLWADFARRASRRGKERSQRADQLARHARRWRAEESYRRDLSSAVWAAADAWATSAPSPEFVDRLVKLVASLSARPSGEATRRNQRARVDEMTALAPPGRDER